MRVVYLSLAFWAALITVWRDRGVDRVITRRFFHYFLFPFFCFFLFRLIAFFFPLPTSQAARAPPWGGIIVTSARVQEARVQVGAIKGPAIAPIDRRN